MKHEEDFDDVGCNADLYPSRQDAFRVSGLVEVEVEVVTSDHNNNRMMHPHCFQSLSLDVLTKS